MNGNPRNAASKKKGVVEALKGERAVNEIAKEYEFIPVKLLKRKKHLLMELKQVFKAYSKGHGFVALASNFVYYSRKRNKVGQIILEIEETLDTQNVC
jgi:hypothetical protein